MHYLQLFITKHEDQNLDEDDMGFIAHQAQLQVEQFLEQYQEVYWDYYSFGGRWSDLFGGRTTVPYTEAKDKLLQMAEERKQKLIDDKPRVLEAINHEGKEDFMHGYYIKQYGNLLGKYYNDEPLFYNVQYGGAFELVDGNEEDESQYYVTVVDIHN